MSTTTSSSPTGNDSNTAPQIVRGDTYLAKKSPSLHFLAFKNTATGKWIVVVLTGDPTSRGAVGFNMDIDVAFAKGTSVEFRYHGASIVIASAKPSYGDAPDSTYDGEKIETLDPEGFNYEFLTDDDGRTSTKMTTVAPKA